MRQAWREVRSGGSGGGNVENQLNSIQFSEEDAAKLPEEKGVSADGGSCSQGSTAVSNKGSGEVADEEPVGTGLPRTVPKRSMTAQRTAGQV